MFANIILLDTFLGLPCPWLWALASLGSFLLGTLLGAWLWRKAAMRTAALEAELAPMRTRLADWEAKYKQLEYNYSELDTTKVKLTGSLRECEADKAVLETKLAAAKTTGMPMEASAAVSAGVAPSATPIVAASGINYLDVMGADNFQIIEGVGPKIETLLKDAGINTWAALSNTSVDSLKQILDNAGANFRLADPTTWPEQARLAAAGQWDDLIKYQKFLDTGREGVGDMETPSKIEKLAMKVMGFSNNPEDLKLVEGIGPKIEEILKGQGINTWSDLANTTAERLREILDAAGERYRLADPTTWPRQAELAATGQWGELQSYQEFLDGGKLPS